MNGIQKQTRNWFIFLMSLVVIAFVAFLGVSVWTSRAATQGPMPSEAFVQLDPTSGEPGTIVTITGGGWQPGEAVLVQLVESRNGTTDGVIYGSAVADSNGRIASSFRYPKEGPWAEMESAIVAVWGATSEQQVKAAFAVMQPAVEPTETPVSEPNTPVVELPTSTPVVEAPEPEPTIPATATPTPVPATPTPTAIPPTAAPPAVKPAVSAPASVQITEWRGEYFNSVNLTGSPLVRNDQRINFDWGYGSPMQGIRADNFSVRWTRQLDLEAKTYRFYVRADDGVRLWVDGQLLIDQWYDGSPRTFSVDRTLNRGRHDIRVEMYERTGQAVAAFWREAVESYPDWRGEYFGNPALSGNPFLVRNDKNIDFNWGGGAPAPGLPADNYSVRWTRQLHFPAGQYRFNVQVDDGARLWVDGRLLIDQWRDGTGTYSGDLYLGEGQHQVRLEMYEHTGGAMARLWWEQKGGFPEWKGEYFTNRKLKGTPALVRNDANINFSWGTGAPAAGLPADGFSVRWTRNLDFKEGLYRFTVEVDDGARLWVDDRLVIDQWHEGVGTYSGELRLSKGKHTVRMEMFEQTGAAMARLWWADQPELLQWKGRYYSNPKLQGEPVLVRKDKEIDFRWKKGAPADGLPIDGFSVRWTRDVEFADGIYRFCATADDGVRVSIDDGNPFINEWHDSSGSTTCQDVKVAQGVHRIKVEYYDNLERSVIKFWWDRLADG